MKKHKYFEKLLTHNKRHGLLLMVDILCFFIVATTYYWVALRAANSMPVWNKVPFAVNLLIQFVITIIARNILGVYRNVWRYANTGAYFNLVIADAIGSLASLGIIRLVNFFYEGIYQGVWQAVVVGAIFALLTLMFRFAYSLIYKTTSKTKNSTPKIPVAIVGAGRMGSNLVEDLCNNPNSGYEPLFFIDTSISKIGNRISNLMVYDEDTGHLLLEKLGIRDVIITIARINNDDLSELYFFYRGLGCRVRVYDSLVASKQSRKGVLREFSIEDLLFRKPIKVNDERTVAFYRDKKVLVTGGGGSIGSEICRQIAKCNPKELIVFDIYENNAYDIQQELIRTYGTSLKLEVEIGSVRDVDRLDELFASYSPDIVFHAAAHKHVPLMEKNGAEAIKNNCFGTYYVANMAEKYGVEKFILISSDKAVNPTNVMGATKRLCEMIIQSRTDSKTKFAAVRFGNVLGSNGSVIPLFKRQIEAGGPITITDKRIIRYFMTIPEASQLVILAGAMAQSGELFVLDMGKPVKIYDLAINMIQLSGLEPNIDIEIKEIGLRPGEKLYEELLMKTEQLVKTNNEKIFVERDTPYSREQIDEKLRILGDAVKNSSNIYGAITSVVPTYHTPGEVNRNAENSAEMKMVCGVD